MQNRRYAADFETLIAQCRERHIAVQTIKSIARRPWEDRPRTYNTYFYEPLETQEAIDTATQWALGLPDSFVITAGDMQLVPKILEAASRFDKRPGDADMRALVEKFNVQPIF